MAKVLSLDDLNRKLGTDQLTEKQYKFCLLWLQTRNGMRSIREAGFSHTTPGSQSSAAHRLLRKEKIKKALALMSLK